MRLLACLVLATAAFAGEPVDLVVLHTNDLHGQLDPLPPSPVRGILRNKRAGGFAHLATMVRRARKGAEARKSAVLLFDAGDLFQGTPVGNESRGDAVVDAMNELGYDAAAVGNHEFDFGVANLLRLAERARFPLLAANMSGKRFPFERIRPYTVLAPPRVPCRVAVIGVITPATPAMTTPDLSGSVCFSGPAPVVRSLIAEVEADFVIVLSHLGVRDDLALAEQVKGIDLILGGHSHTPLVKRVGETLVVQTHSRGMSLARVDVRLDPDGWKVLRAEARLLPVDPEATPADPQVAAMIERHGKGINKRLARVIGRLAAPARRRGGLGSSTAGNWMTDVIRRAGKADVGITNKGGIRCDLEAGEITAADVYRLMPFDNTVIAMDLQGADLRRLVERSFEHGGYPGLEWSGMVVDAVRQGGKRYRVVAIEVGGKPLDDARTYRVATNSFLARGGDDYGRFKAGRNRTPTGLLLRDALAADLAERSPVEPPTENRLRVREKAAR
jgi:5'-nucleotidase